MIIDVPRPKKAIIQGSDLILKKVSRNSYRNSSITIVDIETIHHSITFIVYYNNWVGGNCVLALIILNYSNVD